ncbi:hypothetical protein DY052_07490 [Apilactobacillus timberlakei]|uniref:hypothetical protein n=1 Tax=Apilactobacillus timberlakei TaxID=2008380 RepID=UPI00112C745D|nr:hypothetical protein [Apilactobacillus timberlakei]TPR13696.1 hypothetical protein DY052_07490 [Apilactobacillus timberlakei]
MSSNNRDELNEKYGNEKLNELVHKKYDPNIKQAIKNEINQYLINYLLNLSKDELDNLQNKYIDDNQTFNELSRAISLKNQQQKMEISPFMKPAMDARKKLLDSPAIKSTIKRNNRIMKAIDPISKQLDASQRLASKINPQNSLTNQMVRNSQRLGKLYGDNSSMLDSSLSTNLWKNLPKGMQNQLDYNNSNWTKNFVPKGLAATSMIRSDTSGLIGGSATQNAFNDFNLGSNGINNLAAAHNVMNLKNSALGKQIQRTRNIANNSGLSYSKWLHNQFPYSPINSQLLSNIKAIQTNASLPAFHAISNHDLDYLNQIRPKQATIQTPKTLFSILQKIHNRENEDENKETSVARKNPQDKQANEVNYRKHEKKNHAEILAKNNWVFPVNLKINDYDYTKPKYFEKLDKKIYQHLSANNFAEFKKEFELLLDQLYKIKSFEKPNSSTNGVYNQMVVTYELIFNHPYGQDTDCKINDKAPKALVSTAFTLLEFLNFHNFEYERYLKISKHDTYISKDYFKKVIKNAHLSNYYLNIFSVGANFYAGLDFTEDPNTIEINRNSSLHAKVNPDRYTLIYFMKLILLCRGFAEILFDCCYDHKN